MRHSKNNWFGCRFSLCLILREEILTEAPARRVKDYRNMRGFEVAQDITYRIDKAKYGTCVLSFGIDTWIFGKCVVGSKDKSIRIYEVQLFHMELCFIRGEQNRDNTETL